MRRAVVTTWPPEENVTIERLAFLAAKPYLLRRSTPWWLQLIRVLDVRATSVKMDLDSPRSRRATHYSAALVVKPSAPRAAVGVTNEVRSERMRHYIYACQLAAAELSADERVALRERGELPGWFWRAVDEHAIAERLHARG